MGDVGHTDGSFEKLGFQAAKKEVKGLECHTISQYVGCMEREK